jgi:hypothetical protein
MEQGSDAAEASVIFQDPVPVVLDDWETRKVVGGQQRLETAILIAFALYLVASTAWDIIHRHEGIFGAVVLMVVVYFILGVVYAGLRKFVFRPLRSVRYGRCARRMIDRAQSVMQPVMLEAWKHPTPGIIALDPLQRLLFVECRRSGFHSLLLRPEQIIDVKVEREQTVETVTWHGGQPIFMPFESFGFLGGGRSRSTATVFERAFLEISFVRAENVGVERVAVDFGGRRRIADDWVLAIDRLRGRRP